MMRAKEPRSSYPESPPRAVGILRCDETTRRSPVRKALFLLVVVALVILAVGALNGRDGVRRRLRGRHRQRRLALLGVRGHRRPRVRGRDRGGVVRAGRRGAGHAAQAGGRAAVHLRAAARGRGPGGTARAGRSWRRLRPWPRPPWRSPWSSRQRRRSRSSAART